MNRPIEQKGEGGEGGKSDSIQMLVFIDLKEIPRMKTASTYFLTRRSGPTKFLLSHYEQAVRYEISDLFLRFWFRYFIKYQRYIEVGNLKSLSDIIKQDYPTYSGQTLEYYFRQQIAESFDFEDIGSWWEGKKVLCKYEI